MKINQEDDGNKLVVFSKNSKKIKKITEMS